MSCRHSSLPIERLLILGEHFGEFWVMICSHQVTFLHVRAHIIALVEVWHCCRLIKSTCDSASLMANIATLSVRTVHRSALDGRTLLLLNERCWVLRLLEVDGIVFGATEVDAGDVFRVEVLGISPDDSIQVSVHRLLRSRSTCRSRNGARTHYPSYVRTSTTDTGSRIPQVQKLSLLVEIFALFPIVNATLASEILRIPETTLARLNSELGTCVILTKLGRVARDYTRFNEVCRTSCLRSFVDINQTEVGCRIMHFH